MYTIFGIFFIPQNFWGIKSNDVEYALCSQLRFTGNTTDFYVDGTQLRKSSTLLPSSENHNRFPTSSKTAILGTQKEFSN